MNKKQINQKEMFDVVLGYLDANSAKWTVIPKAGEFKNELTGINAQIELEHAAQQAAQVYVGKNKTQLKRTIAEKADIMNDAVEAFAAVTGNLALENRMATTYTDLSRMRNADFIPSIQEIIAAVDENADILHTEYGTNAEQVDDLKADTDQFLEINGEPRAYQVASVQATKSLELLFNDANTCLTGKLDKVMKIFKRRDVNFYNGYLAARMIVDN